MAATPVTVTTDSAGNVTYEYTGAKGGVAVIDIDWNFLKNFQRQLDLNMNGASSVVIDVTNLPTTTGSSTTAIPNTFSFAGDFTDANTSKVIWNFGTLEGNLTASNNFFGSIIAPDANFSTSSDINGSIFVQSFLSQSGEIHYKYGNNVVQYDGFDPVSVPEPSSIVLAGLGAIGVVVIAMRRRKSKSQAMPVVV